MMIKVIINPDLEKEMIAYIKKIKNKNKNKNKNNNPINNPINNNEIIQKEENKENIQNNFNKIEKKNPKKMNVKKKNKIVIKKNHRKKEATINLETMTNKDLFNFFNDNMVIEYHSDSENDDDYMNGNIYI